jgi:hypothetical protein
MHAALKLMRKLLKKYGFVPDRLITDELRSCGAAAYNTFSVQRHVTTRKTTEPCAPRRWGTWRDAAAA